MRYFSVLALAFFTSCAQVKFTEPSSSVPEPPAAVRTWEPLPSTPPWQDLRQQTFFDDRRAALHHAVSLDGTTIVYASEECSATAQIYLRTSNPESAPIRLTFNGGSNLYPAISPDGKLVAFASDKDGDWNIYVVRIDHPAAVAQVTFSPWDESAPSWSPDGRKIAYTFTPPRGVCGIAVADIDTRSTTLIGPGRSPSWRPKGTGEALIIFERDRASGGTDILTVKPDGTDLREFETWRDGDASNPVWSPDGTWVAFTAVDAAGISAIHLIRFDGGGRMTLVDDRKVKERPSWGGDRISFVVEDHGVRNIYSIRPLPLTLLEPEPPPAPPKTH